MGVLQLEVKFFSQLLNRSKLLSLAWYYSRPFMLRGDSNFYTPICHFGILWILDFQVLKCEVSRIFNNKIVEFVVSAQTAIQYFVEISGRACRFKHNHSGMNTRRLPQGMRVPNLRLESLTVTLDRSLVGEFTHAAPILSSVEYRSTSTSLPVTISSRLLIFMLTPSKEM